MSLKYQWPSSALTEKEMRALHKEKIRTQTPINQLIKMAVKQMIKEER